MPVDHIPGTILARLADAAGNPSGGAVVSSSTARARVASAATTNATVVKGGAGNLLAVALFNNAATPRYFKFYNKATAPTVGTDVPAWTIPLPAGGGYSDVFPMGEPFAAGIAFAITGAAADADATAVAVDDVQGRVLYA